jgi:hypothetical protein
MSTSAQLFIDPMPELAEGAKRYLVDCKWSSTRLIFCPGGDLKLTEPMLITIVIQRHEDECGRCNLARLWRHADPSLKQAVDDAWQQLGAMAMQERRN